MSLFGGVIPVTTVTFMLFSILGITALGYILGRITIKGINLGTAGVFVIAILFGIFFYDDLSAQLTVKVDDQVANYASNALKVVDTLGLILFVSSVGFIAGPKFFSNMKKNFKSYVLLGLVIIVMAGVAAVICLLIDKSIDSTKDTQEIASMMAGLLSGSLTSTPAFSAARAAAGDYESVVSVGYGISYLFGVVGVVLFIQLMPKLTKANMTEERAKISAVETGEAKKKDTGKLIALDSFGICAFAAASILGILVGAIKIPLTGDGLSGTTFSLTTTGGCLLVALVFGHFGKIGKINLMPTEATLKVFREFGLVLFLIGAGIPGGARFVEYFQIRYFIYGVFMTLLPMIVGYLFSKYILKLSLLNNLGSITGGMTSTPALGTLIGTAGTEDVAAAYAATYPIALIAVVVVAQMIIIMF